MVRSVNERATSTEEEDEERSKDGSKRGYGEGILSVRLGYGGEPSIGYHSPEGLLRPSTGCLFHVEDSQYLTLMARVAALWTPLSDSSWI